MKKLKFYEEDALIVIRNLFCLMESETDDINRYLEKMQINWLTADDIFDTLENAIIICEKYNKK